MSELGLVGVHQIGRELGEGPQNGRVLGEGEAASEGVLAGRLAERKNRNESEVVVAAGLMGLENYVLHPEFLCRWQHYPPADHIWVKNSARCIWGQCHAAWDG